MYMIRPMKLIDIPQVQKVSAVSWHTTYEGIIPESVQDDFLECAYSEESLSQRLKNSLFLVVEEDDGVIGYANFSSVKEGGQVNLVAMYLLPLYQGKGIGSTLLEEGIKRSPDAERLFVHVEKENLRGNQFYLSKGFRILSEFEEDFDGHPLQTVRLFLPLK